MCVSSMDNVYLFIAQMQENVYLRIIRSPPFLFLTLRSLWYQWEIIHIRRLHPVLAVEEDSTSLLRLTNLKLHLRAHKDRAETTAHDRPSVQRPKEIRKHPHRVLETQAEANQICHHHHENVAHCTDGTQMAIMRPASPLNTKIRALK